VKSVTGENSSNARGPFAPGVVALAEPDALTAKANTTTTIHKSRVRIWSPQTSVFGPAARIPRTSGLCQVGDWQLKRDDRLP